MGVAPPPPPGKSTTFPETTILLYSDWTKAVSPVRLRDFDKSNGGSRDQIVKSTKTRETWEQFEHAQTKVTFVWRKALGNIDLNRMSHRYVSGVLQNE